MEIFVNLKFFLNFIDVSLTYNAMLISTVQQNDSVIYIYVCVCVYIYIYTFFSILAYHRILNIVPCAIQKDLVVYPSYI